MGWGIYCYYASQSPPFVTQIGDRIRVTEPPPQQTNTGKNYAFHQNSIVTVSDWFIWGARFERGDVNVDGWDFVLAEERGARDWFDWRNDDVWSARARFGFSFTFQFSTFGLSATPACHFGTFSGSWSACNISRSARIKFTQLMD